MDAIEARGLRKVYRSGFRRREVVAVRDLTLTVAPGTVFGLLGPNGSGKTTTLLMLLGLLKPTAGEARVLGLPAGDRGARQRTGFLPEETRLYDFLTGREMLDLAGRLSGMPRAVRRKRAGELLERTGVQEACDRRIKTYSKGMARRIGLAQALMGSPELLVLDEPTSGLDPVGNREVKDLLREEAARGTSVLLSSHVLADVSDTCDAIAILHGGRVILTGAVSALLADARRWEWEAEDPGEERRARVRDCLEREGVRLLGEGRPKTTLEELFLKALEKNRADGEDDAGGPPS